MAETEPEKRKEPEVATDAKEVEEPDNKRQKLPGPDAAVVRKQVEYYLSDENLKHDKFFHEKISSDVDGWLEMSLVLSCKKMKAMRAGKDDVLAALAHSKLELKDGGSHVRRPGNAELPKLETKPQPFKKNQQNQHQGGVITVFKNVPAEQSWVQIKEKATELLGAKGKIWHVSEVTDKGQCFITCSPFDGDIAFFGDLTIEVGGASLKAEVATGDLLQQFLKVMPKHIREKREKEMRKRQKEKNRPFLIGTQKFMNIGALRGKVKEIMTARADGEPLKPEGTDFKLIRALLDFHPRGAEKVKNLVGLKIAKSSQGENRCFWIIREDGSEEDVSMMKCVSAVEENPPFIKIESEKKPEEKKPEEKKTEEKKPEAATTTEAKTTESKEAQTPESKDAEMPSKDEAKPEGAASVDSPAKA